MKRELLRLKLQFFAGETKEEEPETPDYISEGTGGKTELEAYMTENNRVNKETYFNDNNFLSTEQDWRNHYGYDPDRDYQNTVNTLNYEYQTSMATYGEQAEKMYQMGLQNSGVSDIFQANAFSAYLGNMNKAAADRINANKELKRQYASYTDAFNKGWMEYDAITQSGYKSYSDNYDSTLKTNAINGYTAVLESGLFSGEGIDGYQAAEGDSVGLGFKDYHKVSNYLKNLGYDDVTIEEVWKKLARMDHAGLTTDRINAGYLNSMDIYDGSEDSENRLRTTLAAMKLTESEIEQIVQRHKDDWDASEAGQTAAVQGYVTAGQASFDPNYSSGNAAEGTSSMDDFIKNVLGVETDPNAEGFDQTAYNNAVKAWEQMSANYAAEQPERVQEYVNTLYGAYQGYSNTDWDKYLENVPEGDREAVKQAILEQWKSDVGNAQTDILNYIDKLGLDYKGTEAQKADIKQKFGLNYNNHVIDYVLKSIDNTLGVYKEDYEGSAEGIQATADEYVTKYGASFDPNYEGGKDAFIQNVMGVGTTDKESAAYKAAAAAAWEQMKSNYENTLSTLLGAGLNSNSTNEAIQTILNNAGISFDDKMIERLRASLADTEEIVKKEEEVQNNEASIAEMDKIDKSLNTTMTTQGYLTTYDYMNAYKEVEAYEAENGETEATKAKKVEYREKILAEANGYLSGDDGYDLKEAGDMLVGFLNQSDVDNWDSMSDDARRRAIISAAKGEVSKKSGLVTASELYSMVSSYVTEKVQEIVDTDNSNAKASGLADAGELVNYINSLGLNKQDKRKAMESIRRGMSFRIEGDQINWYGSVKGAEATIEVKGSVNKKNNGVIDTDTLSKLGPASEAVYGELRVIDGVLYRCGETTKDKYYKENYWQKVEYSDIYVVGDGHTNTTEQAKGIYDLLVYMLEHENKLATHAGYIEGELPTSTTVTVSGDSTGEGFKTGSGPSGGGHTKDVATQNK